MLSKLDATRQFDILIVGAGHAGAQAAIAIRQKKFEGTVGIIGNETFMPYERPPLSKEYLLGKSSADQILIRPKEFWADNNIEMILGHEVTDVDPAAHRVTTATGERYGYGRLIWATGGKPRKLPSGGHELAGVHTVRTRADIDQLKSELGDVENICIIGGGYIGLEAAAALTTLGKKVTLIEALDRVLARVAGEVISNFFQEAHEAHGVTIRLKQAVQSLEATAGRVSGVRLVGGEIIPCEMVIVGIGIEPSVQPLAAAGAAVSNGVEVDRLCRTSLPDIFAIGDCALHVNDYAGGEKIRLESVQNASDMAGVVAAAVTGAAAEYSALPWFWSNQYDLRLQTIGVLKGYDSELVRGDPGARSFSVIYLRQGKVIAMDCVNAPRDFVQGRSLILKDPGPSVKKLADATIALRELAV